VIGTVVQVNVSSGGIPKRAIASAALTETGIAGDSWRFPFHGGRRKAILLITSEGIDELISQGFALFPGALGENVAPRFKPPRSRRGLISIERARVSTPNSQPPTPKKTAGLALCVGVGSWKLGV
jgi:hypothetical protein